jgi:hypothetical protein
MALAEIQRDVVHALSVARICKKGLLNEWPFLCVYEGEILLVILNFFRLEDLQKCQNAKMQLSEAFSFGEAG